MNIKIFWKQTFDYFEKQLSIAEAWENLARTKEVLLMFHNLIPYPIKY